MTHSVLHLVHIMASLTLAPLGGQADIGAGAPHPESAAVIIPRAKPQPPTPPLFSRPPLHQWPRVLSEHQASQSAYTRCMNGQAPCNNNVVHWQAFLRQQQGKTPLQQILAVNSFINERPYKQDNWIYDANDYWAAPHEFLQHSGDCEDFAIAKYFSLRQLGFADADMQVMLVYDVYSGTDHALLRVAQGGDVYFLDNREDLIDRAGFEKRYRPHVAFNENDVHMYEQPLMARSIRGGDERILPGNR